METNLAWESHALEVARKRRAELRASMLVLERALAAPVPGRAAEWTDEVLESLRRLQADFDEHIHVTEGPDGLYQDILGSAPRLAYAVRRLLSEHRDMSATLDGLVRDAPAARADLRRLESLRDRSRGLLSQLVRHRQRGADLVFEAFETDIGGET
jgi:uncharacterized protein involved in exopolysaccharide biosynthesis